VPESSGTVALISMKIFLLLLVVHAIMTQQVVAAQDAPYESPQTEGELLQMAGPNGVTRELEIDRALRESFDGVDVLSPWFEWKRGVEDEYGLAFGVKAWFLAQSASSSLTDTDDAGGGIYRFQGNWTAFGGDSDEVGRLEWRLEHRSGLGGMLAPANLAGDIGIAAMSTGFGYSGSFSTDLSVLSWNQGFAERRFGFAVGRLASDVYSDAFVFSTFSRGYLNRAFLFNPTQGTTGVGALGIVTKGFVTKQVWLGAHLYDGNAVSGEFDLDTFRQHEWLKEIELGWTPSFARRSTDRIQFLYWNKDERVEAGISSGKGWVMTASYQVRQNAISFVRLGASDGGAGVPAKRAISAGIEYSPATGRALAAGLGWARPSEDTFGTGLPDEYVLEMSYRHQLTSNVSITPDIQFVINPALNPAEDRVWVLGLRFSLAL